MNLHTEFEALAGSVLQTYTEAEETMLRRIASRLARGVDSPGWTEAKYAEIRAVKSELEKTVNGLSKWRDTAVTQAFNKAYQGGSQTFLNEMLSKSLTKHSTSTSKVISILSELQSSLKASDRMILRKSSDAYADIIGIATSRAATGTVTVRQAVQSALDDFADKGIGSFVDKGGSVWEMSNYAEMAVLTGLERASLYGYTDTMQEYGYDLAIISSHAGACPLCVAWQGVIISISGDDHKYPSLDDAEGGGCFHPRCMHHISTYYDGISAKGRTAPRTVEKPSVSYTARSRQRYIERNIRQWKRRIAVSIDADTERYAYNHVRRWQAAVRSLLDQTTAEHLPRKYWREGGRQIMQHQKK